MDHSFSSPWYARVAWTSYWSLAVISSLLLAVTALSSPKSESFLSYLDSKLGNEDCARPDKSPPEPLCGGSSRRARFSSLKIGVWCFTAVLDLITLYGKSIGSSAELSRPRKFFSPLAQCTFQLLRFTFAVSEAALLLGPAATNVWVNPAYGIFGCTVALPYSEGNPFGLHREAAAHMLLGLTSALCFRRLATRNRHTATSRAQEAYYALLMLMAFWYPIYDAKHDCAGSHLSNAGFEFFAAFSLVNGLVEVYSEFFGCCEPDMFSCLGGRSLPEAAFEDHASTKSAKKLGMILDLQQCLCLFVSLGKFISDSIFEPENCWNAPSGCVKGFSTVYNIMWKFLLPYVFNAAFIFSVICFALDWNDTVVVDMPYSSQREMELPVRPAS